VIGTGEGGFSMPEAALAIVVLGLLISVSVPTLSSALSRYRVVAATRRLASEFARLRSEAIASRRKVAMRLTTVSGRYEYSLYADGDGDGIRTSDIVAGRDPRLAEASDLHSRYQGVDFGFLDVPIPEIPPRRGVLLPDSDPVRFGRSDIITFTPRGTSSSGTLYVSDGTKRVMAVVLYGGTGRIRIWRFDRHAWRWSR
jgi:Tfp pilus assembly protein FimT